MAEAKVDATVKVEEENEHFDLDDNLPDDKIDYEEKYVQSHNVQATTTSQIILGDPNFDLPVVENRPLTSDFIPASVAISKVGLMSQIPPITSLMSQMPHTTSIMSQIPPITSLMSHMPQILALCPRCLILLTHHCICLILIACTLVVSIYP